MQIEKIEKRNLVEEVYSRMYAMILSGSWKEGERLPSENLLARQFNVSRVVIREALQILRAQKYVITRQGSGSYISNPKNYSLLNGEENAIHLSRSEFEEMVEFRECIEFRAIECFPERATEQDKERVRLALQGMKESFDNISAYTEADFQFHYSIVLASHNTFMIQSMDTCRERIYGCLYEMNKLNDSQAWGYEKHLRVAEYLFAGKVKAAIAELNSLSEYNKLRYADFFGEKNKSTPERE